MADRSVRIVMNGVTGRMGLNQHLVRSINAIRDDAGIDIGDNIRIFPEPVLVGRDASKLRQISESHGGYPWTTDLDEALSDPEVAIYFDAQTTDRRVESVLKAISRGKHVYCEKPTATNIDEALLLYRAAEHAGIVHGVVQDKLWLPGIVKLKSLLDAGFFGRILSVRGEFGYWVFTGGTAEEGGDGHLPQRPSWNYRSEDGGGIIFDMLCHWRYLLDRLFGGVRCVSCLGATHQSDRWNEAGHRYVATADDAAYATFELEGGIIAQFNSSWCVRVRRDDLLTLQVDGTDGSAVVGLRECWAQSAGSTPRPVWNPDVPGNIDYFDGWDPVPGDANPKNAFRAQWELFLKHAYLGKRFPWNLGEAAKGVQLAECGMESWKRRQWVDIPTIDAVV